VDEMAATCAASIRFAAVDTPQHPNKMLIVPPAEAAHLISAARIVAVRRPRVQP
jgi:hypothetical protein